MEFTKLSLQEADEETMTFYPAFVFIQRIFIPNLES